ncbi:ABC transporter permease, partial [Streptomyces sp. NPDC059346]|uniref:ABC transporter permease n=1 Tax=Streptomyces sp. NPDC059346 TaxID=3346807 RepID=UPI003695EE8E
VYVFGGSVGGSLGGDRQDYLNYLVPGLMALQFGSSIFAPPTTMPGWLRTFTDYNPLSNLADAVRGLMMGGPVADSVGVTLAWAAAITVVMAPLAVSKFRKKA